MDTFLNSSILALLLWALAGMAFAVAVWVVTQALFPGFVRAAQQSYSQPLKVLGIGAAIIVPIAFAAHYAVRIPHLGHWMSCIITAGGLTLGLSGAAGLARRIGLGMMHPTDKDQPWRRTFRGGVALACLLLLPGVNIIAAFLLLSTGAGASIQAWMEARRLARDVAAEDMGLSEEES